MSEETTEILMMDVEVPHPNDLHNAGDVRAAIVTAYKTRIAALWSMANVVTLTGLLGTITGLIRTFNAVGEANPAERQKELSNGIAEAMINTAYGLSIALLCMLGHLLLSTASKKVIADLESFSLKFENLLGDSGSSGSKAA